MADERYERDSRRLELAAALLDAPQKHRVLGWRDWLIIFTAVMVGVWLAAGSAYVLELVLRDVAGGTW